MEWLILEIHVNLRHNKYIYLSSSPSNDTVNDIRVSNNNGIYKIEKMHSSPCH